MSSSASPASFGTLLRRFGRNRRGSVALQFAFVAPLFFGLLFAIIETALMFFANQVLETITQNSARMILTGQAQKSSYTQAQFATYVCTQVPALFNCNNISIDVESFTTFQSIALTNEVDGSCNFLNNVQYTPGGPGAVVVVRLFYQWPVFVTKLGFSWACPSKSTHLLTATAAFKNEPY